MLPNITDIQEVSSTLDDYEAAQIEQLEMALAMIKSAIEIFEKTAKRTQNKAARIHIVDPLKSIVSNNECPLLSAPTIEEWIKNLKS